MSSLINQLNEIYTTKLQIKEVIGTQSDVFSDYPAYIAAAIGTGSGIDWDEVAAYGYVVPAGTVTLSSNGTVDVSTYANAYVSVQSGGITPTGTYNITSNGTFNVTSYAYSYVNVPQEGLDWDDVAQAGYIVPAGTKNISSNGTVDVSAYANVNVNVSGGGSGYYYPVHTVSEVRADEFKCESDENTFIWQWSANEMDGDTGYFSSVVFTDKYWGYCYPGEFEVMENPVLDIDNLGFGLNMVSYTDLVKREFTYNALPDFNTYYGYTYSYQYPNPYYNDENAPEYTNTWDEYLTYEFNYGNDMLYSTQLDIIGFNDEPEEMSFNSVWMNGVWRLYDDNCAGMNGYWDSEMGENTYNNHQRLSIGIVQPSEHMEGPLSQFTTTYHHAASYTSGFDPATLIGYTWNAVVDGRGWLIDIISKGSAIVADDMWAHDPNNENPTYLTASGNNFTRTLSFSDEHTDDYGPEYYEMECNGTTHSFTHNYVSPWILFPDVDLSSEDIPASGSTSIDLSFSGDDSQIDMCEINNYYHDWNLSVTLSIPNNWFVGGAGELTASWTFSGTRNE